MGATLLRFLSDIQSRVSWDFDGISYESEQFRGSLNVYLRSTFSCFSSILVPFMKYPRRRKLIIRFHVQLIVYLCE